VSVSLKGTTERNVVGVEADPCKNQNILMWREGRCVDLVPVGDPCYAADTCGEKYNCAETGVALLAVTLTTMNLRTGELVDADIEMNGWNGLTGPQASGVYFTCQDLTAPICTSPGYGQSGCTWHDLQNTLTHEVGHLLGLDHPPEVEATMYRRADVGETKKRDLHPDDIAGICTIYPKDAPTPVCAQFSTELTGGFETGCACAKSQVVCAGALILLRRRRRRRAL
jgi:hypothetical protein